jgi:hypothetical protein
MDATKCRDCKQGYSVEGRAAYPDHVELCPLHAAAPALLALVEKYRAEAIAQGADVEDVAEIDAALKAAGKGA